MKKLLDGTITRMILAAGAAVGLLIGFASAVTLVVLSSSLVIKTDIMTGSKK